MENKQENKTKETFANAWKKTVDFGKKAADGTKKLVDQTKENIHEQRAKKYTVVTAKEFKSKGFNVPSVIRIEEDTANREFVEASDALGWIEQHKEVQVLHLYSSFVKKSGIVFVPTPQEDNVYCKDNFEPEKYTNANQVFGKSTEEKLAELNNIAYSLGAKMCSIEIVESDVEASSNQMKLKINKTSFMSNENSAQTSNKQSGKTVSHFEGHDNPQRPTLKWFAHDNNINGLIEMRCNKAIKSHVLELSGASLATMSQKMACALDDILKISGSFSMEKQSIKEHCNKLVFELEF